MAAALAEACNDSCHAMQMTNESDQVGGSMAPSTAAPTEKSNVASNSNSSALAAPASGTVSASPSSVVSAMLATTFADSDDDDDDATMHTPSASPAMSFDVGDELLATTSTASIATVGSDFGSGISIATTTTASTASSEVGTGTALVSSGSSAPAGNACVNHPVDLDINTASMPQWKKELIQRRKANIARTIGANQPGAYSKKGTTNSSATMAAGTAMGTATTAITPTSPVLAIAKNFCNDSTFVRSNSVSSTNGSNHSIGVNNGVNARTPDIIQHDASSGGHYTAACGCQQQHQQQLPCVDNNDSSQGAVSSPISAKPKKTSCAGTCASPSTGNDGFTIISSSHNKCTGGEVAVTATTSRGGGTCLTTSPQNDPTRLAFSNRQTHNSQPEFDSAVLQPSSSIPSQLHSRLDVERAADPTSSLSLAPTESQSESCNSVATGTSSFVKNPYVNKSTNKFNKYKSSSAKSSVTATTGSANVNSVTSNVISNISANNSSVSGVTSPSNSSSNNNSRKMVAAQELSDTNDTFDDFDPSEELQYGPGIVSKLRCRYLSLALRQSAGKQRPALDNLRRATSLNNLLDDDDRGSNSSCTTATDHTTSSTHATGRPSSENMGKSPDEFVATFQKNLKLSDKQRSWHAKRGNDSLKRARSVEALVVYGDKAWDNDSTAVGSNGVPVQMRYSYMQRIDTIKPDISSVSSSAEVTIEDKIINARERNSLSEKPPRKITPFMDETERPPPDVVKQTLKLFEATANRRGRGLGRNNLNGEVASKVRNYKSIIAQEKPPIIYPKPPLSPKKNFRVPGTPPGSLDIVATKKMVNNQQQIAVNTNGNNVNNKKTVSQSGSPVTTIPRKYLNSSTAEMAHSESTTIVESQPLTNVTAVEAKPLSPPIPSARSNIPFRQSAKNESTPIRGNLYNDGGHSPNTPDIIPRKVFDSGPNFATSVTSADSPVTKLTKQIERLHIESPTPAYLAPQHNVGAFSPSMGAISPIVKLQQKQSKRSSESENDDDDSLDGESLTKRVSKSALENISKAGTTQQFNFSSVNKTTNINNKSPLTVTAVTTTVNGNSNATVAAAQLTTIAATSGAKQVGIIRAIVAESKQQQQTDNNKLKQNSNALLAATTSDYTSAVDEILTTKARDNLVISNLSQQQQQQLSTYNIINNISNKSNNSYSNNSNGNNKSSNVDEQPSSMLQAQPQQRPTLTSREIEKNLINMKKNEEAASLLVDAANSGDSGGVKWQFERKKKGRTAGAVQQQQQSQQATQNTMIFNFKDRKEVPDYIENDGLLFRRKRELPKPNESGFVLLGDLSLETSTDPDDEWTMGPPSPCDVEFENANIIIDGKSSIRVKSREVSLRVQFDDTLTSTFEYPSESSFFDESNDNANSDNMGHIVVTANATNTTNTTTGTPITPTSDETIRNPSQKLLGSMSLGSAPLGSYIPMKAPITTNFELGVTRNPDMELLSDELRHQNINNPASIKKTKSMTQTTATTNGNSSDSEKIATLSKQTANNLCNSNGSVDYILNGSGGGGCEEPESLQYLKPATDDLTVAYSEGTQKTDLLY